MSDVACLPGNSRTYFMAGIGGVLYVGQSADPETRWATHRASSPWAHFVTELHFGPEGPVDEVRAQERALIRDYRPRFNIMCNPDFEELGKTARRVEYQRRIAELQAIYNDRIEALWRTAHAEAA